ncbi:MAG: iron-sulfur cluster assembly scaffold protein [Nitrososphaeria archaeon]
MYSKELLKHFRHPKHMGSLKDADVISVEGNPVCGDVMKLYLKIKNGKIQNIKFETFGCVAAIGASDILCEIVKGKSIEEAEKVTEAEIVKKAKGFPQAKVHCSLLAAKALKKAIEKYKKVHLQDKN